MKRATAYAIFAIFATVTNIAAQDIVIRCYGGSFAVEISIAIGTIVGLIVKYVLDKRYIFSFTTRNILHEGRTFAFYTLMGIVTTAIFWGTEMVFDYLFQTKEMRYLGGVIGLAIGYLIKYQLDKRYVFRSEDV